MGFGRELVAFRMKRNEAHEVLIRDLPGLRAQVQQYGALAGCTLLNLALDEGTLAWDELDLRELTILGGDLSESLERYLRRRQVVIFPRPDHLPFDPFLGDLYQWQQLAQPVAGSLTLDEQIYEHFSRSRFNPGLREALYQRIHDHAMDDGLRRYLDFSDSGMTQRRCVGIMGGHSTHRDHPDYRRTAEVARQLTAAGYLVVSGGGPGIMEAANLGAYLGGYDANTLTEAIELLSAAPHYQDAGYHDLARKLLRRYPDGRESLAIPTWFYGHEPSNVFATAIAKYFSNSLREDNLLAICLYGVIFAPGSAGTTQEIFQDAAQNHYATYGYVSPMVFLGTERYLEQTQLYSTLRQLASGQAYANQLYLSDVASDVVAFIEAHPPVPA